VAGAEERHAAVAGARAGTIMTLREMLRNLHVRKHEGSGEKKPGGLAANTADAQADPTAGKDETQDKKTSDGKRDQKLENKLQALSTGEQKLRQNTQATLEASAQQKKPVVVQQKKHAHKKAERQSGTKTAKKETANPTQQEHLPAISEKKAQIMKVKSAQLAIARLDSTAAKQEVRKKRRPVEKPADPVVFSLPKFDPNDLSRVHEPPRRKRSRWAAAFSGEGGGFGPAI